MVLRFNSLGFLRRPSIESQNLQRLALGFGLLEMASGVYSGIAAGFRISRISSGFENREPRWDLNQSLKSNASDTVICRKIVNV